MIAVGVLVSHFSRSIEFVSYISISEMIITQLCGLFFLARGVILQLDHTVRPLSYRSPRFSLRFLLISSLPHVVISASLWTSVGPVISLQYIRPIRFGMISRL